MTWKIGGYRFYQFLLPAINEYLATECMKGSGPSKRTDDGRNKEAGCAKMGCEHLKNETTLIAGQSGQMSGAANGGWTGALHATRGCRECREQSACGRSQCGFYCQNFHIPW